MSGAGFLQEPRVVRVGKLLQEVYKQHVRVPRFQRPFVWTDDQRLELLHSIYRGMPIGSILVWRTSQALPSYDRLGHLRFAPVDQARGPFEYVLDGHQRLTTLYGALMPGALSGLAVESDDDAPAPAAADEDGATWPIYFDLKERKFCLRYPGETKPAHFLPLEIALDAFKLFEFQRALLESDAAEVAEVKRWSNRAEHLSSALRDYAIPVLTLVTESGEAAAQAFVSANSQGSPLSALDALRALSWPEVELDARLSALRVGLDDEALVARLLDAAQLAPGVGALAALAARLREDADALWAAAKL